MKIIGAVMVFAVCAYSGFALSSRLRKRRTYLQNMCQALNLLETEISFGGSRLKQAFIKIDRAIDTRGLFKSAADLLEELGIKRAWKEAVLEKSGELRLNGEDADALALLGERLGMTDTADQVKNIVYTRRRIEGCLSAAEGEYDKLGRLYRSGGILTGLFLVLILI